MRFIILIFALIGTVTLSAQNNKSASIDYAQGAEVQAGDESMSQYRRDVLKGVIGTYALPPRQKDGRVDMKQLIDELKDLKANTYHWLIGNGDDDYEDLKAFLPIAAKNNIDVWVTLLPPSEARTRPIYRANYQLWAKELAELSLKEPNLVAWSIDDFGHNQEFFSSYYINLVVPAARKINPKLAFIPCVYFGQSNAAFVKKYGAYIDGVLFPFRNESVAADLKTSSTAADEIKKMQSLFGANIPIVIDVYAYRHSRLGDSTPQYVDEVIEAGMTHADGLMIYCHMDPQKYPEKYAVLKKQFAKGWKK